jgi:hypothetical protein
VCVVVVSDRYRARRLRAYICERAARSNIHLTSKEETRRELAERVEFDG